jgi:hypothetical protein
MRKEWKCFAHGFFESDEPRCPHGCDATIERAFLTAPGIASTRTRNIDNTLKMLAMEYGFTDLNNRRGNGSVAEGARPAGESAGQWVDIPKGNQGIQQALTAQKAHAGDAALDRYVAANNLTPPEQPVLPRPKPLVDPQHHWGKPSDITDTMKRI